MCGIYFSVSRSQVRRPSSELSNALKRRGPDSHDDYATNVKQHLPDNTELNLYFFSTVLSLRGSELVEQPLVDPETGSVLCWNGEAWSIDDASINENDSKVVFQRLLQASLQFHDGAPLSGVLQAIGLIRGPFAFVFYDAKNKHVFYGRDCLGRRSLVETASIDALVLASVADPDSKGIWSEVEADGIRYFDLNKASDMNGIRCTAPFIHQQQPAPEVHMRLPFGPMNKTLPASTCAPLHLTSLPVISLKNHLHAALSVRVRNIRQSEILDTDSHVAVLFSGGLDCSIIARMMHDLLGLDLTIDLINVAFQNPRIHKPPQEGEDLASITYNLCPDRITGNATFAELQQVCPSRRWRFVEVNVPFDEYLKHKSTVLSLIYPHNTEMDLSIASALYFAARGIGKAKDSAGSILDNYTTKARVLMSGLGADELFGGYQRHATAFNRQGSQGLVDELELDVNRLGKRNLGRDDRVISSWGKEVRFPYLDENLVRWALNAPVWDKCGFGSQDGERELASPALDPEKLVLRLVAWTLGMKHVALEKKRAIQFGARTAKMESKRVKGTHVVE